VSEGLTRAKGLKFVFGSSGLAGTWLPHSAAEVRVKRPGHRCARGLPRA